jgi:hypothetical protein
MYTRPHHEALFAPSFNAEKLGRHHCYRSISSLPIRLHFEILSLNLPGNQPHDREIERTPGQRPLTMDIDDILREVDPSSHGIPLETRDLQALTRLWVAERSAPELLK